MGMRTILASIPCHLVNLVSSLRVRLRDRQFIDRHRVRPEDFTRDRQLTFPVVMLFVLQKTVKSIQRHLHEFLQEVAGEALFEPVTAGAWTHARAKLKHTAFVELNEQVVLPSLCQPSADRPLRLWQGHRLVGIDSSLVRLPESTELCQAFTVVETGNQLGPSGIRYPEARMSVLYDLWNHVGLEARLEPSSVDETDLAIQQLQRLKPGDLTLSDRGFPSYLYFAWHRHLGLDFVARCQRSTFAAAQELFRMNRAGRSVCVKLRPSNSAQQAQAQKLGLPLELVVRFVSVRLSTGELEVLATSLLDEELYPTEEFLGLYHERWGHETFYGTLKGRLDLENFSGKTVEAVRQDFYATLLLCNLESALSQPATEQLSHASANHKYPKQINHAVAYHALKDQMLDLLYSNLPAEAVLTKLQMLFVGSPVPIRPERKAPRRKPSSHRSYHFQKRVRKIVF
jgi:hypothetical protein